MPCARFLFSSATPKKTLRDLREYYLADRPTSHTHLLAGGVCSKLYVSEEFCRRPVTSSITKYSPFNEELWPQMTNLSMDGVI